jgi:glycopeptide antibiotics resistance protein
MYAGLTFLALWVWPEKFTGNKQFLPLLAVILWGFSMEVLQGMTHYGRSFDLTDELANTLGFIPGWLGWRWFGRRNAKSLDTP